MDVERREDNIRQWMGLELTDELQKAERTVWRSGVERAGHWDLSGAHTVN